MCHGTSCFYCFLGQEDALGRPLSEQIGGLKRTYAYDAMGHLTAMSQGSISHRGLAVAKLKEYLEAK